MIFGEWRRWLNNLSRNSRGRVAGRKRARPARLGMEVLEGREVPAVVFVDSVGKMGDTATATDNDYTRIQQALDTANSGDTIQLRGTFDWTEVNAAASWAKGNDGIAGNADDYRIQVRPGLHNVTLSAGSLGDATIQGPGDVATRNQEGFLRFSGGDNQNWTISNLRILDFDLGIGMFNGAGGADAFDGTTITNNYIRIAADLNGVEAPVDSTQNIGIHYSFGKNQTISNNVIEIPGTGVSDPSADLAGDRSKFSTTVGMQSNTSGSSYDGLRIIGNEIRVLNFAAANRERIIGFWDNAHGHLSDIEVSNNKFLNLDPDNDSSFNLQQAFWVTSHSGAATTVTYSGNQVEGASIGFKWMGDPEFPGQNFSAHQAVRLWGNTAVDCDTGVLIQGGGVADLFQNTITGSGLGGAVNVINGRLTGVEQNDLSGGAGDAIVLGVNSSVTGRIFNNNLATADLGIRNNGAGLVNASGNWWGTNAVHRVDAKSSGNVDFTQSLVTGEDTELHAAGFQGNFSVAPGQGSVRVKVVGGRLMITGDNMNNWITVEKGPTANSYRVTGLAGTQINGLSDSDGIVFENVTRGIDASLKRGNDMLVIDGSASPDTDFGTIKVWAGRGDDVVRLEGVNTDKAEFGSAFGNDLFQFIDSSFSELAVDWRGNGASTSLELDGVTVTGRTAVRGGNGDDSVRAVDSSFGAAVVLSGGRGNDVLDAGTDHEPNTMGNTFAVDPVIRGFETEVS